MDDDPEPREVYDALLAYRIRQTIVCVGFSTEESDASFEGQ
ncbi:MAG: hypothetical protein K0Q90_2262 [Paenibacillaceae bacterium]|nr:hypothetical protein [Paenibacillaceae bacterium]